jgi:hypothetical protein
MGYGAVLGWLGGCLGLLASGSAPGPSPEVPAGGAPLSFPAYPGGVPALGMPRVPLEELHPGVRERVRPVVEQPTLAASGPSETFTCQPAMYRWLLDNTEQAIRLWRQIGARVNDIEDRGNGRCGWRDGHGSDVYWDVVLRTDGSRLWYAEGRVKLGKLLPASAFRAVVLLTCEEGQDGKGRPTIRHRTHLWVRTDSRAVALAARILGGSAPRLAEQYLAQTEMFFGGLAWYLDQDPDRARRLFAQIGQAPPAGAVRAAGAP